MLEYIQNSWSVFIVLEVLEQKADGKIVHATIERSMNNENSRTKDSGWKGQILSG